MSGFKDYKKVEGKLVAVAWNDAHHSTDEVEAADTQHRPSVYVSAGILLKSDDTGVTLSLDLNEDGRYRGRTFIPRAMVIEEWEVGPLKPKQKRRKKSKADPGPPLPFGVDTP